MPPDPSDGAEGILGSEVRGNEENRCEEEGGMEGALRWALVAVLATGGTVTRGEEIVNKEYIDPQQGFTQVVTTEFGGVKTVHVSGQVGWEAGAESPGEGLAEQAEIAFHNLLRRLEQAGAAPADVVKTTVFIKDIEPDKVRTAGAAQAEALGLERYPASTWVGVTGLVDPRLLLEVEATAVLAAD